MTEDRGKKCKTVVLVEMTAISHKKLVSIKDQKNYV